MIYIKLEDNPIKYINIILQALANWNWRNSYVEVTLSMS